MATTWRAAHELDDELSQLSELDPARPREPGRIAKILLVAWLAIAIGIGVFVWRYKLTPGATADAPEHWPVGAITVPPPEDRPVLVMFAHPKCSCTRASLATLTKLLGDVGPLVRAHVVFLDPDGAPADFFDSETVRRAKSVPGLSVSLDRDGQAARRFGALTSGHVVLYSRTGALMFSGGITSARGHEGESYGTRRIRAVLRSEPADRASAPTFGCELFDRGS
jgi:hypothetical protein